MIKKLLFILMVLFSFSSIYADADYPYDIANATYDGQFLNPAAETPSQKSVRFNDDGSKVFLLDSNFNRVYEYSCTTNFLINTCSYDSIFLNIGGQESSGVDFIFNDDGSKIYVIGQNADRIFEYDCSTNYAMNTCSYSSRNLLITSQESNPEGISFNDDGSKVYVVGRANDEAYEYDCSTNYQINTCTYNSNRLYIGGVVNNPVSINFNDDGSLVFFLNDNRVMFQYSCTNNYDITSCSYDSRFFDTNRNGANNMAFNNDGSSFYLSTSSFGSSTTFQFNINFTPPTPPIVADVQEYYRSQDINITLTTLFNTSMSYVLDGGSEVDICTNCTNYLLELFNVSEGFHNIVFISDVEGNTLNSSYNFTVDTTFPVITDNIPDVIYSYQLDGNNFNCGDTNLQLCYIEIQDKNETQGTIFDVTYNGFTEYFITAVDLAGNSLTVSNTTLFNPIQKFQAFDGTEFVQSFSLNEKSTTNGTIEFLTYNDGLTLGVNNLSFSALGYVTESFNVLITNTSNLDLNLSVSPAQIIVNIFDRVTGDVFNQSTMVNIFGLGTQVTTNGSAIFQNFTFEAGNYSVEAISSGYYTEQQQFEYSGESNAIINMFLLLANATNSETLVVTTTDEFDNVISGVDVRLQEYDVSIFGFKQVSQCTSNSNGECQFLVETSSKSYRLVGSITINDILYTATNPTNDDDGEVFLPVISGGEEVLGKDLVRQLRLKITDNLVPASGIGLNIEAPLNAENTIIDETNTSKIVYIPVEFFSSNGLSYTVCLDIFLEQKRNRVSVITPVCLTGASGILPTENISLNKDFDYVAEISVQYDGDAPYVFRSYEYSGDFSFERIVEEKGLVPNVVLMLWVIVLALARYFKNMGIFAWGSMILSVFQVFLFPNILIASSTVIIILIAFAILQVSRREVDLQ